MVARREQQRERLHRIALVVVLHGIAEIDRIGGIRQQFVLQLDGHRLGIALYRRLFALRRRYGHLLHSVVELDVLVEMENNLLILYTRCTNGRIGIFQDWRSLVVKTATWAARAGAAEKTRQRKGCQDRKK